jgi:alanyl-tRNA synthetase
MMTAKEIRDSFKKFFESKGHAIVPSAPMVINLQSYVTTQHPCHE